jgi:hypothetical protein
MDIPGLFGNGHDRPPSPEMATLDDVHEYSLEVAKQNPMGLREETDGTGDPTFQLPFTKQLDDGVENRALYPWLFEPERGVPWDFDPVSLRNLGQTNTWVGMLVQTITKEVAETPWTISRSRTARNAASDCRPIPNSGR